MNDLSMRTVALGALVALGAACGGSDDVALDGEGGEGAATGGAGGTGGSALMGGAGGAPAPVDEPTVGVVGCSITLNALNGYIALGGERLWPVVDLGGGEGPAYPGGSVVGWVSDLNQGGGRWLTLEAMLDKVPQTQAIWWELCSSGPSADLDFATVAEVAQAIADRAPDLPIYVSASPQFPGDASLMCNENDGPTAMAGFVTELVAGGYAEAGPVLTALQSDQVGQDGCHAQPTGEALWGQDLVDFFGPGGGR